MKNSISQNQDNQILEIRTVTCAEHCFGRPRSVDVKQNSALCPECEHVDTSFSDSYTRQLPNLGCNSSQRVESFHPIFKKVLHGQLTLEQSAQRIAEQVKRLLRELATDEDRSRIQRPNIVDEVAFRLVIGRVTHKAILLVANDWQALKVAYNSHGCLASPQKRVG